MSAQDMILEARRIRQRLLFPSNAVPDDGIDLKRIRIPIKTPPSPPIKNPEVEVLEHQPEEPKPVPAPTVPLEDSFKSFTFKQILSAVSDYYGLTINEIKGRCKRLVYIEPRHVAFYLCQKMTRLSFTQIGRRLERDHTTVMHGVRRIEEKILVDLVTENAVNAIKAELISGKYGPYIDLLESTVATKPEQDMAEQPGESPSQSQVC